jgi:hypothetical protein
MGKRELVLIALFVLAGVVVYQVTAPPAPAGTDLSVGGIFQRMRRNMQGARESATGESHRSIPVAASVQTVRINLPRASDLTITAAVRDDISIDVRTTARGYTQGEAKALADAASVAADTTADAIALSGSWDDRRGPSGFVTQATISIALPRRLAVRLEPHIGLLSATGVASIESMGSRGETHVLDTPGAVVLTHTGGTLEVRGGASLKLTSRNSRGEVTKIDGPTRIDATGSRLTLTEIAGPLEIESRNADINLERLTALKPSLRYNGSGGTLRIDGLRVESRIDGHNTDIDVKLDAAAPVTIYNLGAIGVTAPPGGYTLDASASEGRITTDEPGITPTDGADSRAGGTVRGGGPALTLRATRGRIDIRRGSAGK